MLQFVFFSLYIFCVFLALMFRTDEGNGAILESEAEVAKGSTTLAEVEERQ